MTGVAMWQRRDRISETEWSTWREVNATEVAELDGKYDYIQFRPLFTQSPRIEDHAAGDYLSTHEGKIRMAFLLARKNAEVRPPDIDDKALWDHELKALDEALASATPSVTVDTHKAYALDAALAAGRITQELYDESMALAASFATPSAKEPFSAPMSEADRIEFALRDAGFDYDRAYAIAHPAPSAAVGEGVAWQARSQNADGAWSPWSATTKDQFNAITSGIPMEPKCEARALYTTPTKPGQWEQAIIEAAMITEAVSIKDRTPKQILDDVIDYHVALAGDPVAKPGHMVDEMSFGDTLPDGTLCNLDIAEGWNACRVAMLNATQGGKGEGE